MLHRMDTEELTFQMAYDLVEAEELAAAKRGRSSPASAQWIDLAGPDVFEQLKQRMGMAA